MSEIVKQFTSGSVVIEWRPDLCEHSSFCFRLLPEVFNPRVNPWIQPENASTEQLIQVVRQCPSGSLRIQGDVDPSKRTQPQDQAEGVPAAGNAENESASQPLTNVKVNVVGGGPLEVRGEVTIQEPGGAERRSQRVINLCRCGHSKTKPYCDLSHLEYPGWDLE